MRTTVRLHEPLLAEAKKYASETGKTLTTVIEDALREKLARRKQMTKRRRVRLPTFPGGKLQPGVDLDDNSALLDLMEGRDVAH
jgi:hypothetical protein